MLEIKNISINYLKGMPILKDISLNIKAGEIVGIFGSSGCGKSTLAKIMAGNLIASKSPEEITSIETEAIIRSFLEMQKQRPDSHIKH